MANDIKILGIDLGTTNSAIAIWDPDQRKSMSLPNQEGDRLTPSMVTFNPESGDTIVGRPAKQWLFTRAEDVIYSVKRFIGLSFQNKQVTESQEQVTYRIESAAQNKVIIRAAKRVLTPPQVSGYILEKLKKDAEAHLKMPITKAVITVPAYFTESQRHATIDAGRRANLDVCRLVNEPTAAALAFDLGGVDQKVAVYDLGGGTFDVSIIEIRGGMYRVVATSGDNHLGGDDFDYKVANWIKDRFRDSHHVTLGVDSQQMALLYETAEKSKIELSEQEETRINISDLRGVDGKEYDLAVTLTREVFESLIRPFIDKTLEICDTTLEMARQKTGLLASDISQVLLVGGQTITPAVRNAIHEKYGWRINNSVEPGLVVALGAGVLGGYLSKDKYLKDRIRLWDVVAQPLGVEIKEESSDVGPKRTMMEIIKANQQIPIRTERTPLEYTTNRDGQTRIEFRVYQGFHPIAEKNTHLGTVPITLTTPRPKGEARVKCWFEIDCDGILLVHAKELDTDADTVVEKIDYYYYLSQKESDQIE